MACSPIFGASPASRTYLASRGTGCATTVQPDLPTPHERLLPDSEQAAPEPEPGRQGDGQLVAFDDIQAQLPLRRVPVQLLQAALPRAAAPGASSLSPPGPDAPSFLPTMYKGATLFDGKKTLILDAKCYGRIFSSRFEQRKLSAEHARQIFYYASHSGSPEDTSILLVYTGTEETGSDERWSDQGYSLGCVTLDLNRPFPETKETLEGIPRCWLNATSNANFLEGQHLMDSGPFWSSILENKWGAKPTPKLCLK